MTKQSSRESGTRLPLASFATMPWYEATAGELSTMPPFLTNLVVLIGGAGILPDGSGVAK